MPNIENVVTIFLDAGAAAMRRYAELSYESPDALPEYFLSSYIFDRFGTDFAATLETSFSKLTEWNNDVRTARQLPLRSRDDKTVLAETLGNPRIDMAVFSRENSIDLNHWRFLVLAEFKKGDFSGDRQKLLDILAHVDTCPYGLTCGSVGGDANLRFHMREAEKTNDQWQYKVVEPLPNDDKIFFFCARLFKNPAVI